MPLTTFLSAGRVWAVAVASLALGGCMGGGGGGGGSSVGGGATSPYISPTMPKMSIVDAVRSSARWRPAQWGDADGGRGGRGGLVAVADVGFDFERMGLSRRDSASRASAILNEDGRTWRLEAPKGKTSSDDPDHGTRVIWALLSVAPHASVAPMTMRPSASNDHNAGLGFLERTWRRRHEPDVDYAAEFDVAASAYAAGVRRNAENVAAAARRATSLGAGVLNMSFGRYTVDGLRAAASAENPRYGPFVDDYVPRVEAEVAKVLATSPFADTRKALNGYRDSGGAIVTVVGNTATPDPEIWPARLTLDVNRDYSRLTGDASSRRAAMLVVGALDSTGSRLANTAGCGEMSDYCLVARGDFSGLGTGTSFSAPQVSGAIILMTRRWSSVSSQRAAYILLDSADDSVDEDSSDYFAGYDSAVHGHGRLNLEAAFSAGDPVETGSGARLSESRFSVSSVFGDSLSPSRFASAALVDRYGREWKGLLSSAVRMPSLSRLESRFGLGSASERLSSEGDFSGGRIRFEADVVSSGASGASGASDMSGVSGVSGIAVRWLPSSGAIFSAASGRSADLSLAPRPLAGMLRSSPLSASLRLGSSSSDLALDVSWSGESGFSRSGIGMSSGGVSVFGLEFDRARGSRILSRYLGEEVSGFSWLSRASLSSRFSSGFGWSAALSVLDEEGRVASSSGRGAFGGMSSRGASASFSVDALLWSRSRLFVSGWMASFRPRGGSLLSRWTRVLASGGEAGASVGDLWIAGDRATISVRSPLRVESGVAELSRLDRIASDGERIFARDRISLSPSGREVEIGASHDFPLGGGRLQWSASAIVNSGHVRDAPLEGVVGARFTARF